MIPFIELHISNVHAREEFRHKSYLSDKAKAVVCGLGVAGYGQYRNLQLSVLSGGITADCGMAFL